MVQSKATSVDQWMNELAPDRAPTIAQLRQLCRERLTGWEERMQWGMPGYGPPGQDAVLSFNSQKQHIALYAGQQAIEHAGDRLAGIDCGKGCIRYRKPEQMDFAVIADMLDQVRQTRGA